VIIGADEPQSVWKDAVEKALLSFRDRPYLAQRFHKPKTFTHTVYEERSGAIVPFPCKVRLCPYYFALGEKPTLAGALATLCPPDKKILHGMKDAILVPAGVPTRD